MEIIFIILIVLGIFKYRERKSTRILKKLLKKEKEKELLRDLAESENEFLKSMLDNEFFILLENTTDDYTVFSNKYEDTTVYIIYDFRYNKYYRCSNQETIKETIKYHRHLYE